MFWNACTHDVTKIACQYERLLHPKYEHEKTKNGQITTSPDIGTKRECTLAQTIAEMAASRTGRFVINDNTQSPPPMSKVSNMGLITIIPMSRPMAGTLYSGLVSSVITPVNAKIIAIISEGIRLINPVRRTYLHIEI